MEYKNFLDYKFDNFNCHLIKVFNPDMKIMMQSTCRLIFVQFCWTVLKWRRDELDFVDLPRMCVCMCVSACVCVCVCMRVLPPNLPGRPGWPSWFVLTPGTHWVGPTQGLPGRSTGLGPSRSGLPSCPGPIRLVGRPRTSFANCALFVLRCFVFCGRF